MIKMVDKIPTTTVNITTSDTMRQGQNYKINKKIWELIEESKNNGTDLEERLLALEESDIKEKMGYDNIPEGESLMSQIIELQEALDGNDEPQNNGNENIETNSRDITFSVTSEGYPLPNYPVTVDEVTENTDENGQVVFNLVDGSHIVKMIVERDNVKETYYYNDAIVTDASHTEQVLAMGSRMVSIRFVDKNTQELIEGVDYACESIDVIAEHTSDVTLRTKTTYLSEIPYTFKVYSDDTKSELLDEKSIDRDDSEVTFEV